jgi:hypothetical protein
MSADGVWKLTAKSPMGNQDSTLDLRANGATLTGTQADHLGTHEIQDGKIDGTDLSWSITVAKPISMTLSFACAVEGDQLKGKVKAGVFGTFEITGARA